MKQPIIDDYNDPDYVFLYKDDYKKNKDKFKPEYLVWDKKTKSYKSADKKDFSINILPLKDIPDDLNKDLLNTVEAWKKEVMDNETKIKDYKEGSSEVSAYIYTRVANPISKRFGENKVREGSDLYCCYMKNKDEYLSISIFSIPHSKSIKIAELDLSLACPKSQYDKDYRENGTFGACGHNIRVSRINYIFENSSVSTIACYPDNLNAREALKKYFFVKRRNNIL